MVEKHFILNKKIKSPDSSFSYDPKRLKNLIKNIREVEIIAETINKKEIIKKLKTVSRSIFYSDDISRAKKYLYEALSL